MKFPRNVKILRSPFEMAPFAAVLFLLAIFLLLAVLLPPPGIPLQLPAAGDLPGVDRPTVAVAVDAAGRFFFANKMVSETELTLRLAGAAEKSREPLTLVIRADKTVTLDQLAHLTVLARHAGITNALLATLPGAVGAPPGHE
jgi:biopolymer transport protein ExbD